MRFLVTGSEGYLGKVLCKRLRDDGHEVVGFDREETYRHDLNDKDATLDFLYKMGPFDGVYHLAARAVVRESIAAPCLYYSNNVSGSVNLLGAMNGLGMLGSVPVTFASSCSVYGEGGLTEIKEEDALKPMSPYARSKLMCEQILADYEKAYGLRYCALRIFNIIGADGVSGDPNLSGTRLLPNILEAEFTGKPMTVNHNAYRDYVDVEDVADAFVKAMTYLKEGGLMRTFNVCTGKGTSVTEMIVEAESIVGKKIPFVASESDPVGDPFAVVGNNDLAQTILNWHPTRSLRESIQSAWDCRSNRLPKVVG